MTLSHSLIIDYTLYNIEKVIAQSYAIKPFAHPELQLLRTLLYCKIVNTEKDPEIGSIGFARSPLPVIALQLDEDPTIYIFSRMSSESTTTKQ